MYTSLSDDFLDEGFSAFTLVLGVHDFELNFLFKMILFIQTTTINHTP